MFSSLLYVEDDDDTREEIAFFLRTKVHNLLVASNGKEGLELFEENLPEIVISDIQMPTMDGLEMSEKILKKNPKTDIILLTAHNDTKNLHSAISVGIKEYLTKPINFYKLSEKLDFFEKKYEEKRVQKENYRLLQEYKEAVDNSTIFIKMDIDGSLTYANDAFCEILGYDKDNLMGKTLHDFDMYLPILEKLLQNISKGETWKGPFELSNIEQTSITVDGEFFPMLGDDGEIQSIMGILHDVTELNAYRKVIQNKLDETKINLKEQKHYISEYSKILEKGIVMCRITPEGFFLKISEAFKQTFKIDEKSLPFSFTALMNWEDEHFDNLRKTLSTQNVHKESADVIIEKTKHTFKLTCIGMYALNGELEEIVITFEDITSILTQQKKLYDTQVEFLFLLAELMEKNSEETGLHTKRVSEYTALIANGLNMDNEEVDRVKLGSIMHDIGKLGIPQDILGKKGPLTPQERLIMQNHSKIGFDILKQSKQPLMQTSAIIAHQHHEKYDGTGYPRGLKGEEIHIYGRIVAIADVFDALSNKRCYKDAWDIDEVYKYLKDNSGAQFDPTLIDIFLNSKDMVESIRKTY